MSFLACLTVAPFIRASLGRRHHYRCLQNIARLERDLGMALPSVATADTFDLRPGAMWPVNHTHIIHLDGPAVARKRDIEQQFFYGTVTSN